MKVQTSASLKCYAFRRAVHKQMPTNLNERKRHKGKWVKIPLQRCERLLKSHTENDNLKLLLLKFLMDDRMRLVCPHCIYFSFGTFFYVDCFEVSCSVCHEDVCLLLQLINIGTVFSLHVCASVNQKKHVASSADEDCITNYMRPCHY